MRAEGGARLGDNSAPEGGRSDAREEGRGGGGGEASEPRAPPSEERRERHRGVQRVQRSGGGRREDGEPAQPGETGSRGGGRGGGRNDGFMGAGDRSFGNMRPVEVRVEGVVEKVGANGGRIRYGEGDTTPPKAAQFSDRELREGLRLQEGDTVSFSLTEDMGGKGGGKGGGFKTARSITLLKAGGALPRYQGMVQSFKDKFGFIRQLDGATDLFFHCSEVPRGVHLSAGDEVEFCKVSDSRTKKEAATRLEKLPKGTVEFELVLPTRYAGIVSTALTPQASSLLRRETRADKLMHGGVVSVQLEDSGETTQAEQPRDTERGEAATTGASDERQVPLAMRSCSWADRVSDDDEESECRSYPSSAKPARASPKAAAPAERAREGGSDEVVGNLPQVALKPIRHEERLGFGMDDIEEEWRHEGLYIGDRVELRVAAEKDGSARGATSLRLLKASWHRGFVVHTKDTYAFIRPEWEPIGSMKQFFFPYNALAQSAANPRVGDEVEFRICSDGKGRDSRLTAGMVQPLCKGSIVTHWLLSDWWKASICTPLVRRQHQGSYNSRTPSTQDATASAKLECLIDQTDDLPPCIPGVGEMVYSPDLVVGDMCHSSTVETIARLRSDGGCPSDELSFGVEQMCDRRQTLVVGDSVGVQLKVHVPSGRLSIANVRLLKPAPVVKERGVAVVLKDCFGFLRCETREGQVFFHYAEVEGSERGRHPSIRPGDEFEFELGCDERSGKQCAIHLRSLPRGTVRFEERLLEGQRGTVVSLNVEKAMGEILADALYEGEECRVSFARHSVSSPGRGFLPPPGCVVTFTLGKLRAKGTLVAFEVRSDTLPGFVDRIFSSHKGIIRTTHALPNFLSRDPSPPRSSSPTREGAAWRGSALDGPETSLPDAALPTPAEPDAGATATAPTRPAAEGGGEAQSVVFYTNELDRDVNLCTGDEVEFVLGVNPKNGELAAHDLRLIKEAPKAPERHEWVRKDIDPSKITRYAKGPDGTKGFTLGRGRPLAPPTHSDA